MPAPIMVQRDDVDKLPPSGASEPPPWGAPRARARLDWPAVVALCVFALLACPLLYWLFADTVRYWYIYDGGSTWVKVVMVTAFIFACLFAFKRFILIEQPGGFKIPGWQIDASKVIDRIADAHYAYAANEKRNVRALTFSPTYHHQVETNGEALALPAPEDTIALTPDTDWLRWVDRAPHLLLAGKTEAGKTTMASALLTERILAGDQILVLDPHYQPGKWFGVDAISGISAILETLPALIAELEARYEEFKRGKQTEEFERLTVLIDEVPAIVDQCIEMTASGRPKVIDWRWRRFAKKLGSEARKVRISVVLLSQSTLVQDLMINIQMKENFTRIGLGDQARPLLGEEPLPKRKQALFDLLRGQAHPAAMEYRGDFYLLDTSNVKDLAERNVRAQVNAWNPDEAPALRADPDDAALLDQMLGSAMHSAMNGHTQNGANGIAHSGIAHSANHSDDDTDAEELAIEMFAAGLSQREVGAKLRARGLTIDQNEFPRLQREGLRRDGA